jgi:branched-chain amino acid transport system ATP-binding protein
MLDIKNIQTFYGKIQALRDVSIKVNTGEIVSLIGANGAGKSTLLMTVSGINKPREGVIIFEGKNIEKEEPHKIVKLGISQSPEGSLDQIFMKMEKTI